MSHCEHFLFMEKFAFGRSQRWNEVHPSAVFMIQTLVVLSTLLFHALGIFLQYLNRVGMQFIISHPSLRTTKGYEKKMFTKTHVTWLSFSS